MSKVIPVTKSFLPPIEEYMAQIKRAYNNEWLTNRGELVLELEQKLTDYLELREAKIICMNNGTIPLQIALKLLGKGGEIITTPFSYVATTSAILWENCTPIFVDIHPDYLTIDESKIEDAITEKTTCILATHVFGNPCNIEEIQRIADKYNLKVIYDAAHCFGVKYKGKSIFEYGDISTCSFHATKLFHTGEGGALFTKDIDLFNNCFNSHNFGHAGHLNFHSLGINGKISELQAAMGLSILPYMSTIIQARENFVCCYDKLLDLEKVQNIKIREYTQWNFSYYPVIFKNELILLKVQKALNEVKIYPRRYFYPSLNLLPFLNNDVMVNSENIASKIMCLPLSYEFDSNIVKKICNLINDLS
jgi:dTDP-4-amino-4,6-dideoxygalactose transaminase